MIRFEQLNFRIALSAGLLCFGLATTAQAQTDTDFQSLVDTVHARYAPLQEGANADYIPILTETPSDLFGVVIVTREGKVFAAGDVDYEFSIQSVSKPFTAALVMSQQGTAAVDEKIGVEPTGLPFNSKMALEIYDERSVNPLVNAGAIAAVSMVQAGSEEERWNLVLQNISDFAGRPLGVLEKVYDSEYTTAFGNRGIANLLYNYGRLYSEPEEALRVYTRQCSIGVSARDLGMMGATLANQGVNPKTGVGGGIVAVVPGRFAIATFSARLNAAGNSVRGMKAIRDIAGELGVGVYGANP
jgi:glutaminase